MHLLTKNSVHNANHVRDLKGYLESYASDHVQAGRSEIAKKIAQILKDAMF